MPLEIKRIKKPLIQVNLSMSSNESNTSMPIIGDVEKKETPVVADSLLSHFTCARNMACVESCSSTGEALPVPQAVLDALTTLSPRKSEVRVDLPPISLSQFEKYTMVEQSTPTAFSFNETGLLSPRSVDPQFQMFCQTDHDNASTMCVTYAKTH
ncbi:hypothetical protein BDZ94DRAFT_1325103 [Collybia nuda]|uniref:Uncharacterized protein n=1 Tax=Collybia nuda TaxID=64659 RepID=A0A9P6CB46_9AGAR|nr:hypothetical protein BDZ94DRAFT_1325103 [Collybia nuda]